MENQGLVTLSDMLAVWMRRPGQVCVVRARAVRRTSHFRLRHPQTQEQRLVIVADSCHSGMLIDELRALPKSARDGLNVGIQTACLSHEVSAPRDEHARIVTFTPPSANS